MCRAFCAEFIFIFLPNLFDFAILSGYTMLGSSAVVSRGDADVAACFLN
jgi:hypothetical protein